MTAAATSAERAAAVLESWREVYRATNGKEPPTAAYSGGWVLLREGATSRHRLSEVLSWTDNLRARLRDQQCPEDEAARHAGPLP